MTIGIRNLVLDAWHIAAIGLGLLLSVMATGHAVLYKRDSRAAIAWVGFIWLLPLVGAVATLPTSEILPGTTWADGSVTVTLAPAITRLCRRASRSMVTTRCIDLTSSTGPALAPTSAAWELILTAPGSNTTAPHEMTPSWVNPSAFCPRIRIALA